MAGSRREFLCTGGVWSRDAAVRFPPAQLATPGMGSVRLCVPCAPGHPQHDFIFWPKRGRSCFTACCGFGTSLPDNVSLWLPQICWFGSDLVHHLVLPASSAARKLMASAGSMFFPRERAQVRREGASKQPKLGVLGDGWSCVPFSHTCRQCPLVLLPFGQSWER